MVVYILDDLRLHLSPEIVQKGIFDEVVSHFEKVDSTGVLNEDHKVHVVVAGLDKATMAMHYYFAVSRSLAMP